MTVQQASSQARGDPGGVVGLSLHGLHHCCSNGQTTMVAESICQSILSCTKALLILTFRFRDETRHTEWSEERLRQSIRADHALTDPLGILSNAIVCRPKPFESERGPISALLHKARYGKTLLGGDFRPPATTRLLSDWGWLSTDDQLTCTGSPEGT